jgi:hypothetical protein
MYRQQRIIKIHLQNTVRAIKGAVEVSIDDKIVASYIVRSTRAGLHIRAFLAGDQKVFFPFTYGIPRYFYLLDQILGVLDVFNWELTKIFQDSVGEREGLAIFGYKNLLERKQNLIHHGFV